MARNASDPERDLLRVTVTIGPHTFEADLGLDAQILNDPTSLNKALADQPTKFARWAMLESKAKAQVEELKTLAERLEAKLFTKWRQALLAVAPADDKGKQKAPTLDEIKSRVALDPDMVKLTDQRTRAQTDLDNLSAGRQTMYMRKDTLLAIASNMRQEMDSRLYTVRSRETTTYPEGSRAPGALKE